MDIGISMFDASYISRVNHENNILILNDTIIKLYCKISMISTF